LESTPVEELPHQAISTGAEEKRMSLLVLVVVTGLIFLVADAVMLSKVIMLAHGSIRHGAAASPECITIVLSRNP
jgi:hypothetical protein